MTTLSVDSSMALGDAGLGDAQRLQLLQAELDALHRSQAVIEFEIDGTVRTANENFLQALGYRLEPFWLREPGMTPRRMRGILDARGIEGLLCFGSREFSDEWPAELDRWKQTLRRFLAMLAVRDPRRPVLKSPPHTARVGVLADMFPESRFLHVVRDPFVVIPSTLRLWKSLHDVQSLQVERGATLEEYVFAAFAEMHDAFERDRATLPADRLHEVRYEELVADPVERPKF
jgi:hypothetical protein